MPGFKQVKLDITSDPSEFERAAKRVGDSSKRMEDAFERVGAGASRLGGGFDRGRSSASRYGDGLDGVGNRADELDTRMMGTSDAITGVSDLMAGPGQVGAAGMAMGMADLGSAMYNTVIPSLKDGTEALKGFIDRQGGMAGALKGVGFAAGGVGLAVAAGTIAWNAYQDTQAEVRKRSNELADAFEREAEGVRDAVRDASVLALAHSDVGGTLRDLDADFRLLAEGMRENPRAAEELDNALGAIIAGGLTAEEVLRNTGVATSEYTAELIRLIDQENLSAGQKKALIDALDGESDRLQEAADAQAVLTSATEGTAEANRRAAEEIRGVSDALAAQVDPAFAVIDANNRLADAHVAVSEAQAAVNTAAAEFGAGSPEHVQALQDLQRAREDEVAAGWNQQQSLRDLATAMAESGISVDGIIGRLQAMVGQNGVTQESVDAVAASLRDVPTQVHSVLTADATNANWVIEGVAGKLRTVRNLASGITVTALAQANEHQSKRPKRAGGTAAMGGIRGADVLVGEEGPELVNLPGGSYVYPAHTTASMMRKATGGSGPIVNLYVQGSIRSDRDLLKLVRDELARGGLQGVRS